MLGQLVIPNFARLSVKRLSVQAYRLVLHNPFQYGYHADACVMLWLVPAWLCGLPMSVRAGHMMHLDACRQVAMACACELILSSTNGSLNDLHA